MAGQLEALVTVLLCFVAGGFLVCAFVVGFYYGRRYEYERAILANQLAHATNGLTPTYWTPEKLAQAQRNVDHKPDPGVVEADIPLRKRG